MSENKRNETALKCEVVRDLLPLYHDGVVSDVTKTEIERHLAWCQPCMEEYELLRKELPVTEKPAGSSGKRFAGMLKRLRKKRIIVTAAVSLASVAAVLGGLYFLTSVPIRQIPADAIHVHKVYRYDFEQTKNNKKHDTGYYLYMSADSKYMSGGTTATTRNTDDGGLELVIKCPMIVWDRTNDPDGTVLTEVQSWDCKNTDSYFAINGKKVWTAEEGNDGEVPGYVYDDYLYQYDDGSYGPDCVNSSNIYNINETGKLGETFVYNIGGNVRAWSLDGELLFEGTEKEWNKLNKGKYGE